MPIESPLDFSLLPMTELRNGPGEILDRVADKGEAFIIERNGQRKACLVPLSYFLPEIAPSRMAAEFAELERHGEEPRTTITSTREIAMRFDARISNDLQTELTVVLPNGYPSNCPRVYARSIDGPVPHRWADGALCLFGVMSAWNPGKHTVWSTLSLARRWLAHYDVWKQTHHWPTTGHMNE